jgi:hypothetical protein
LLLSDDLGLLITWNRPISTNEHYPLFGVKTHILENIQSTIYYHSTIKENIKIVVAHYAYATSTASITIPIMSTSFHEAATTSNSYSSACFIASRQKISSSARSAAGSIAVKTFYHRQKNERRYLVTIFFLVNDPYKAALGEEAFRI